MKSTRIAWKSCVKSGVKPAGHGQSLMQTLFKRPLELSLLAQTYAPARGSLTMIGVGALLAIKRKSWEQFVLWPNDSKTNSTNTLTAERILWSCTTDRSQSILTGWQCDWSRNETTQHQSIWSDIHPRVFEEFLTGLEHQRGTWRRNRVAVSFLHEQECLWKAQRRFSAKYTEKNVQ